MANLEVFAIPDSMHARILELAARLFVAQGYHGISMREIASECGLSKAGLYYHFRDKEDLFLAILDGNLSELEAIVVQAGQQPGGARERITFFVRTIFTRLPPERRAIIRLASQEMAKVSPAGRADFERRYHAVFVDRLAGILAEGCAAGELREMDSHLAVWGLLGLMYPFFHPGSAVQENDLERITGLILMVFLEGVQAHD